MKQEPLIRELRYDMLRTGDTFHSRTDRIHGDIIAYATAWEPTPEGRRQARDAVRNPLFPNHSGTVLERWGQKYPIEASPRGYISGDFREYCTKRTRIVAVYRWQGYDDPAKQELVAKTLERWSRIGKAVKYNLPGAILSSRFGRYLLGWMPWVKAKQRNWFCSEGAVGALCVSGFCGDMLPYNIPIADLHAYMAENQARLPKSLNPYDVAVWQALHPEFYSITGYYAP